MVLGRKVAKYDGTCDAEMVTNHFSIEANCAISGEREFAMNHQIHNQLAFPVIVLFMSVAIIACGRMKRSRLIALVTAVVLGLSLSILAAVAHIRNLQPFRDSTGYIATYNTAGEIDERNAFFQQLGTNGRTCASCHQADQAFGLDAAHIRRLFVATRGRDPLFAPVDGANCPNAKEGDAIGHSLLLNHGLVRVAITLPASTEFGITAIYDPYGCAVTADPQTGRPTLSVYRRPLPSTNLRFLSTIMFDGRETLAPLKDEGTFQANLVADLKHQAHDAIMGHAQARVAPSEEQLSEIVKFELGLSTAQVSDDRAGMLFTGDGRGGPLYLNAQSYYPGINDSLGHDPHEKEFDPTVFTLYSRWQVGNGQNNGRDSRDLSRQARARIAAGEEIFNAARLKITAVRGLNDNPELGNPTEITGTCGTCHDTPNVGNHSLPLPLDISTSHSPRNEEDRNIAAALTELHSPDVPIYLITNCPDPQDPGRRLEFYTSDPGRALVTGKCSDVNRIKGPILRGLAARAPYFHNGSATSLEELVNFYNKRFQMELTEEQKDDLVAFLNSL